MLRLLHNSSRSTGHSCPCELAWQPCCSPLTRGAPLRKQTGRPRHAPPAGQQAGGIRRLGNLPGVPRRHLQRLPEESPPSRGNRQEARLGKQRLRILPRPRQQARGIHVRGRYPQPGQAQARGSRQASASPAISISPRTSGRINSSHAKNQVSCVACHSIHKNGPNGLVAAQAGGHQPAVRRVPHRRLGQLPAALQTPAAGRRHVVRGLPQSARQLCCRAPCRPSTPTSPAASSATATSAGRSLSSTLRCAWKAAAPAMSRTARPTRAC